MAIAGIVALAFITMAIVAAVFPEDSPAAAGPTESIPVANPFPPLPTVDPTTIIASPSATAGPVATSRRPPSPTPPKPPATASGSVDAAYSRLQDQTWVDGFQAKVTLINRTNAPQSWQVKVVFADNVTPTTSTWINGAEPPILVTQSHGATFTSRTDLPANGDVTFYFQVAKTDGSMVPLVCTVNGQPCLIG